MVLAVHVGTTSWSCLDQDLKQVLQSVVVLQTWLSYYEEQWGKAA